MVTDSMQPDPPHFANRTIGNDRRVFNGKIVLIAEPIGNPGTNVIRRKLAGIHPNVEWMLVMVLFGAHVPQPRQKRFLVPQFGFHAQITISIPSRPTSTPAAQMAANSGEPFLSIGFVLLMCV